MLRGFHGAGGPRIGVEDFLISARPPADRRTIELFARVVGPAVSAG